MRVIYKNLFAVSSAELLSRGLAFITSVYLARVLGTDHYGILGYAAAIVSYFNLLVVFGFETYGAREVAKKRTDTPLLVNSILSLRLLLAAVWYVLFLLLVALINETTTVKLVLAVTGLILFSNAAGLNWVFQGLEKMSVNAVKQFVIAVITLVGVLWFVDSSEDTLIAAIITSAASLAGAALWFTYYRLKYFRFSYTFDKSRWRHLLRESFPIALSSMLIAVYFNLDMVMLGAMKGIEEVSFYSAAYKIYMLFVLPFQLILRAFFPQLSRVQEQTGSVYGKLTATYALWMVTAAIIGGVALWFGASPFVHLLFGEEYAASAEPLSILALCVGVVGVNMLLGNPLIAWGRQKVYAVAVGAGAVANLVLNFILIPQYSYNGAAAATLLSELAVFLFVAVLFFKHYPFSRRGK